MFNFSNYFSPNDNKFRLRGIYVKTLYTICLSIGVVYSVLSVLLGGIFDIFNLDGNFDFPFASFLRPIIIVTFLTIFGGVGFLTYDSFFMVSLAFAFLSGLIASFIMWKFILIPLQKAENTSSAKREELIGIEAVVLETIPVKGVGAITYSINGNKYSSPAKSVDDDKIPRFEKVLIVRIENSTFYVSAIENSTSG